MYVKWLVDVGIRSILRCLGTRVGLKAVQIEEYVVLKILAALESTPKGEDCPKSTDNIRGVDTCTCSCRIPCHDFIVSIVLLTVNVYHLLLSKCTLNRRSTSEFVHFRDVSATVLCLGLLKS